MASGRSSGRRGRLEDEKGTEDRESSHLGRQTRSIEGQRQNLNEPAATQRDEEGTCGEKTPTENGSE